MLGEIKKINYGTKEVDSFIPYTLNELYITSKKSEAIEELIVKIEKLLPLDKPANKFFYDLILDSELIDSLNYDNQQYTLADLHSPGPFDLFSEELKETKAIYEYAPNHLNKLGYSNRFLKDLHYALFLKFHGKYPGDFRKAVSFIGGESIEEANFVSAEASYMQYNMDEMELFMHRDDVNIFVRSSLIYYQIMANLPFLIGNGLIGRIVSQLYLREMEIIESYIPLSRYFKFVEEKRLEAMNKGDINIYVEAYLEALYKALKLTKNMISGYNRIRRSQRRKIEKSNHTIYQKRRLNEMLYQSQQNIYLQSEPLQDKFKVLNKTIIKRYRLLEELGIIKCHKTYFQKLYYNEALLKLLK